VVDGGGAGWRRITGPEPVAADAAQAAIDRELGFDPDIWVLEIEDPDGRYTFDGPVV